MQGEREPARRGAPAPARLAADRLRQREDGDGALPALLSAGNAAVSRLVQRSAAGPATARDDLAARLAAEAGRGQPLPTPVQRELEAGSGASLDGVQVHTGSAADSLARDLGAQALTTGPDIYFRSGAYNPSSAQGYRLLAHEVTHTIQQRGGPVSGSGFAPGVAVSDPGDVHERAAETAAGDLVRATTAPGRGAAADAPSRSGRLGTAPDTVAGPAGSSWSAGGGYSVQRFSGYEHESLGDATGAEIDLGNGIVLNWGQVLAIAGDEVGSVDELQQLVQTDAGRRRIRAALEHAEVRRPITSALPAPTKDDQDSQKTTYVELAMRNVSHFAAGGDALETWRSHHARALQDALAAGLSGNAADFERAQLVEAFGQHFLTDLFSGGHVRVPRREIMDLHAGLAPTMAAAFVANLRRRVEDYLVSQIMMQVGMGFGPPSMQAPPIPGIPSIRGPLAQDKARDQVRATVDAELTKALNEPKVGGMAGLTEKFGLALAGAVSGALHDRDGRQGVHVASEDHPMPWLAMGDSKLDDSPAGAFTMTGSISREQAEKAVLAGREQLLAARAAGERETVIARVAPADPPTGLVVHFAFNSAALDGAQADVNAAGAYLHVHPDSQVNLTGHTDPLGTDDFNLTLGQRRADAVKAGLLSGGAQPDQVSTTSLGEASPVVLDPKRYGDNRRVEFVWQSRFVFPNPAALDMCVDPIRERAQQVVDSFGPPYPTVERYIPYEVPLMNDPLPEWRWGKMAPEIISEVDRWIREMVGEPLRDLVAAVPETMMASGYTFTVRNLVQSVTDELLREPAQAIGRLIGQPPG